MNHDALEDDRPAAHPPSPDDPLRRRLLSAALLGSAGLALPALAASTGRAVTVDDPLAHFSSIAPSTADLVRVSDDHAVALLYAWGDPVSDGRRGRPDASDDAAAQNQQAGMHHDGMHFFPFMTVDGPSSTHGLLCINHEYVDEGLLHADGATPWTAEKVAKSQAAHGVSVIEVELGAGGWQVVRPSRWARRITAATPCQLSGPARAHPAMLTAADRWGTTVLGTFNNCAMGVTPWGTYLTCEENFNGYFKAPTPTTADQQRYGIKPKAADQGWPAFDERFDLERHPNEAHRFGWVVEIDPWNPGQAPIKRTALGRFKHEGATCTLARDGRVVVYMGDDERFEYIYKFVSRDRFVPGSPDNARLLDEGTLYVARFDDKGKGRWLPLRPGEKYAHGALTAEHGFATQGDIAIRCRQAADLAGATKMDRPEWIAVHPDTGEVYVTLTNNSQRGQPGKPGADTVNPRPDNISGHIVRWRENRQDAAASSFTWDIFALAGNGAGSTVRGDAYACPDGLWFDPAGHLWIQTDIASNALNQGDYAGLGNNQMLVADPESGETRRFLTGPNQCEVTGITATPDGRHLFVNIQHPGEPPKGPSNPATPLARSAWPANQFPEAVGGRPRSATLVITRRDGRPVTG